MSIRFRIDRTVVLALACVAAVTAARADDSRLVQRVYAVADLIVPIKDFDLATPPPPAPTPPAAKCATQAALTCSFDTAVGLRIGVDFDVKCGACEQPCPTKPACCAQAATKCCADAPCCKEAAKCCDKTAAPACCPNGPCCPDGPCCPKPAAKCGEKVALPSCCPNGPCCPDGPCCPKGMAKCCDKAEPQATMQDRLIKLVTSTVSPWCWCEAGGKCSIDYYPIGMALVVNAPSDVQERVADLLESLRRLQDSQVAFDVKVVSVSDACFPELFDREAVAKFDGGLPMILSAGQARDLLRPIQSDRRTTVMQSPKLTVFNGQRAAIRCTDELMFVTGVDAVNVNGQTVHVPKNSPVTCGFQMSVRPTVSADRKFVRCELKAEHTELAAATAPLFPVTTFVVAEREGGGTPQPIPLTQFIQQPQVVRRGVEKSLAIPDGGTAVLYAGKRTKVEGCDSERECAPVCDFIYAIADLFTPPTTPTTVTEHMVVLVTPRVIVREEEAAVAKPCVPCPTPVRECVTAEVAPRPMPCGTCCPVAVAPPCPLPAPAMPAAAPQLQQVQLDMCVVSVDPAYWDRPDAAAWADLSPKACDGQPKPLAAGEARRFCQSMRAQKVGKMLAEPRMVALSGQPATFLSGGHQICLTSLTVAARPDGTVGPDFESSTEPFGVTVNVLPTVCGDRIDFDCECSCSEVGKECRVTIEVPGEEPRVQTFRRPANVRKVQFRANVPSGDRAVLIHCGRDADGRDLIVTVAPSVAARPPVPAYPPPATPVGMVAPCPPTLMPTVWTAPMAMPFVPAAAPEPPCDPKLVKFMDKYYQACADGHSARARKFAEKCMAIDPTCFGK